MEDSASKSSLLPIQNESHNEEDFTLWLRGSILRIPQERKRIYREFIDWIQTLCSNPKKNRHKLEEIFKTIWNHKDEWQGHESYSLHFLHGLYFAIRMDLKNAVGQWIQMDNLGSIENSPFYFLDFSVLPRIRWCYNLSSKMNYDQACKVIVERLGKIEDPTADSPEKEKLCSLKVQLENAIKMDTCTTDAGALKMSDKNEQTRNEILMNVDSAKAMNSTAMLLKKELEECQHYFIYWLNRCSITRKKAAWMIRRFYEVGNMPNQQTEEELEEDLENNLLDLKWMTSSVIETFLHILCGNDQLAAKTISWIEFTVKFMEKNNSYKDYCSGMLYLCNNLKIHATLVFATVQKSDLESFSSNTFENLSDKGKAVVLLCKWTLPNLIKITGTDRNNMNTLIEIRKLDSEYYFWPWKICNQLIKCRKTNQTLHPPSEPTTDEIESSWAAVELSEGTEHQIMCMSVFCQILADILHYSTFPDDGLVIGVYKFQSSDEVLEFIKSQAREAVLAKEKHRDQKILTRYAFIFSSDLPEHLRDLDLSKECEEAIVSTNLNGIEELLREWKRHKSVRGGFLTIEKIDEIRMQMKNISAEEAGKLALLKLQVNISKQKYSTGPSKKYQSHSAAAAGDTFLPISNSHEEQIISSNDGHNCAAPVPRVSLPSTGKYVPPHRRL